MPAGAFFSARPVAPRFEKDVEPQDRCGIPLGGRLRRADPEDISKSWFCFSEDFLRYIFCLTKVLFGDFFFFFLGGGWGLLKQIQEIL